MFNPNVFERVKHKIAEKIKRYYAPIRRKRLTNTDFTIISNNCWGGVTYEGYGIQKQSPTVGCYLFAKDYLKLVRDLKKYMEKPLEIISLDKSKYKQWIVENHNENCPIGRIEDIEIVFVHYHDAATAKEKWDRRVQRINWDNLIFKFSYMNHATEENLREFDSYELPGKKLMFVNQENHTYKCGVYYPGFEEDDQVYNDTFYWNRYFNVTRFLNTGEIHQLPSGVHKD